MRQKYTGRIKHECKWTKRHQSAPTIALKLGLEKKTVMTMYE